MGINRKDWQNVQGDNSCKDKSMDYTSTWQNSYLNLNTCELK
jgi:hypothetical protein